MDINRELREWLDGIALSVSPEQRKILMQKLAQGLRDRTKRRIRAQRDPDGNRFAPRKKNKNTQIGNQPIRFLYLSNGRRREVYMKNYMVEPKGWTGFDLEASGIRTFHRRKVIQFLPAKEYRNGSTGTGGGGRIRQQFGQIRSGAMFTKIPRQLRTVYSSEQAAVGFTGRIASVARIHQYGLRDRPSRNQQPVSYPQRELLGFSQDDQAWIMQKIQELISQN